MSAPQVKLRVEARKEWPTDRETFKNTEPKVCALCGKKAHHLHELLTGWRRKACLIFFWLCASCHGSAGEGAHTLPMQKKLLAIALKRDPSTREIVKRDWPDVKWMMDMVDSDTRNT